MMTEHYRQLVKLIRKQVNKYWMLHNTRELIEGVSEKAQSTFINGQSTAIKNYNLFTKVSNK